MVTVLATTCTIFNLWIIQNFAVCVLFVALFVSYLWISFVLAGCHSVTSVAGVFIFCIWNIIIRFATLKSLLLLIVYDMYFVITFMWLCQNWSAGDSAIFSKIHITYSGSLIIYCYFKFICIDLIAIHIPGCIGLQTSFSCILFRTVNQIEIFFLLRIYRSYTGQESVLYCKPLLTKV